MLPLTSARACEDIHSRIPDYRDDTFANTLNSVVAGRVANRLDLGGANYTLDAACASGLTALALATEELVDGRSELSIVGAVDASQTPYHYLAFSRTGALSPSGEARVFDESADGTVISEGAVVLVLKRLADAERDGDRIYGVIKGAANSSDGKALGLTAPRPVGQRRALRRAYDEAGISPRDIAFYEAHGTGTPVGDQAEIETITNLLDEAGGGAQSCAIGSVKSLIGHTKTAAGLASFAKVMLALRHRVLPPHAGVEQPIGALSRDDGPVCLLDQPRPWFAVSSAPRRAGASAFGFGGTNCHIVAEEYRGAAAPAAPGGEQWPAELLVLADADHAGLARQAKLVLDAVANRKIRLRDLAYTLAMRAGGTPAAVRATFCAASLEEAIGTLAALAAIEPDQLSAIPGLEISSARRYPATPRLPVPRPGRAGALYEP